MRSSLLSGRAARYRLATARRRASGAVNTGPATDLEGCTHLDLACRVRELDASRYTSWGKSARKVWTAIITGSVLEKWFTIENPVFFSRTRTHTILSEVLNLKRANLICRINTLILAFALKNFYTPRINFENCGEVYTRATGQFARINRPRQQRSIGRIQKNAHKSVLFLSFFYELLHPSFTRARASILIFPKSNNWFPVQTFHRRKVGKCGAYYFLTLERILQRRKIKTRKTKVISFKWMKSASLERINFHVVWVIYTCESLSS